MKPWPDHYYSCYPGHFAWHTGPWILKGLVDGRHQWVRPISCIHQVRLGPVV